jgi:cytochrome c biogenesis protein
MRTALVLLLLLALAAVPGSLVPQRTSDPNGVIQYEQNNPDAFKVLDSLGVFETFGSPWFSAIYLLLFISLVGCVVPRTKHHFDALRARPPKTPARLQRLVGFTSGRASTDAATAVAAARSLLRRQGYRTELYPSSGSGPELSGSGTELSVSAERGYLRETGNLIFHSALVGILVTVALGGGFGYTGQKVIVQDTSFTNVLTGYDSFTAGRFFNEKQLVPYSLRLDEFTGEYRLDVINGKTQPLDFTAELSTRTQDGEWEPAVLKVNAPLEVGDTKVYLLGNGYAPVITVRDPDGVPVYSGAIPFLPQDANLTSLGVVKVPDGLAEQLGIIGFFYPDPVELETGAYASLTPYSGDDSLLTLTVYQGDLGLDTGAPVNVYSLNTDDLEQIAGRDADAAPLELTQGQTAELPNGLGSIEFTGLQRFVSLDIHHDPTEGWVLAFALIAITGLLVSLFIPRRRVWVKASPDDGGVRLEYAGLARGEDPGLSAAVAELAERHQAALRSALDAGPEESASPEPRMKS